MVFSSLTFIFRFLPIFLLVYYICPIKYRNICLFAGSLVFYSFGEPVYLFLILCSLLFNYACVYLMGELVCYRKSRCFLFVFTLIINFGLLLFFKYTDFFIQNANQIMHFLLHTNNESIPFLKIGLPLGISFYTFQIVSYVIDVFRNRYPAEKNLLHLGVYLCMFPQLIAGPIITYPQIHEEIKKREYSKSQFENGLQIFILGLGSKVILANRIGILWHEIQTIGYDSLTTPLAWLGAAAFTFQIYFDFYGYSLMARGLGYMLGFHIPQNFNHPYLSLSMTEFFRKWHMTLGYWFREYVYIPLGGNQKGEKRTVFNLLFVWFLTGLWHGASWNFIIWGFGICILIILEKFVYGKYLNKYKPLGFIYMLLIVPVSWIVFAITNMNDLSVYFSKLFTLTDRNTLISMTNFWDYIKNYGGILLFCALCSTFLPDRIFHKYRRKPIGMILILAVFWMSVYYLANSINNPFLYFRF